MDDLYSPYEAGRTAGWAAARASIVAGRITMGDRPSQLEGAYSHADMADFMVGFANAFQQYARLYLVDNR